MVDILHSRTGPVCLCGPETDSPAVGKAGRSVGTCTGEWPLNAEVERGCAGQETQELFPSEDFTAWEVESLKDKMGNTCSGPSKVHTPSVVQAKAAPSSQIPSASAKAPAVHTCHSAAGVEPGAASVPRGPRMLEQEANADNDLVLNIFYPEDIEKRSNIPLIVYQHGRSVSPDFFLCCISGSPQNMYVHVLMFSLVLAFSSPHASVACVLEYRSCVCPICKYQSRNH